MKIVPRKRDRSRGELRKLIVAEIAAEVQLATTQQRDGEFPELAAHAAAVKEREDAVAKREAVAKQREDAAAAAEKRSERLRKAAADYWAWMQGAGEVDAGGRLFDALRDACEDFHKETKR